LPDEIKELGKRTFRTLAIDGEEFEFSEGFTELHTKSYEKIIMGNGFDIGETRAAIQLVHDIRNNK
jgi:UDP-N-acetyl-2-amino-2-deoxyglucuronate dehydrogenase